MRMPGKGVIGVAAALILAAVAGGVLSRSLLQSHGARAPATQSNVLALFNDVRLAHSLHPLRPDARLVRRGSLAAEILSFGGGTYATPAGMLKAWMASPAHRRVILLPELRYAGFGVATGTFHGAHDIAVATADFSSG